jgi:hypothetical protein
MMNVIGLMGPDISSGQARAIAALVPVTEAIANITNVVKGLDDVEDIERKIEVIRSVANFVRELTSFSRIFQEGGWFGLQKSSSEQFEIARKSIDDMVPMIEALIRLTGTVKRLERAEGGDSEGEGSYTVGVFSRIGNSIQYDLLTPLLRLREGVENLNYLEKAVQRVDSAMKSLTKNNSRFFIGFNQMEKTAQMMINMAGLGSGGSAEGIFDSSSQSSGGVAVGDPSLEMPKTVKLYATTDVAIHNIADDVASIRNGVLNADPSKDKGKSPRTTSSVWTGEENTSGGG